jgi:hypothetical protein
LGELQGRAELLLTTNISTLVNSRRHRLNRKMAATTVSSCVKKLTVYPSSFGQDQLASLVPIRGKPTRITRQFDTDISFGAIGAEKSGQGHFDASRDASRFSRNSLTYIYH